MPEQSRGPDDGAAHGVLAHIHPVAFALLSLGVIFVLYQIVGGGITFVLLGGTIDVENVHVVRWATLISQVLFILLPTLVLGMLRYGSLRAAFRFRPPRLSELIAAVVAVFALQQILQVYMLAQDAIPLPEMIRKFLDMLKQVFEQTYRVLVTARSPGEFLAVVVTVAVVPALAEEFFFRGLVQKALGESAGGLRAAVLAGMLFGVYHLNPLNVVPLMCLGVFFGLLVYRTGGLSLAVAAHFFNNFLASLAAYLGIDEEFIALAPGSAPSVPILVATVLVFGLIFLATMYVLLKPRAADDTPPALP